MRVRVWVVIVFALAQVPGLSVHAVTTTLFVTGDDASGISGAVFKSFEPGSIDQSGRVAFRAQLQPGSGGVTANDDQGIWLSSLGGDTLVARTGSGGVPDASGADFLQLQDYGIGSTGDVFVRGSLAHSVGVSSSNDQGIWRFTSGVDTTVVRTGVTTAPGVLTTYSEIPQTLRLAGEGQTAFSGELVPVGDVNNTNNEGIWSFGSLGDLEVARNNTILAPGVNASFNNFSSEVVLNESQQVAFRALLEVAGSVTASSRVGIWRYTGSSGELIAREGVGNVPGIESTSYTGLGEPSINGAGQISFAASLTHYGSIGATNDTGLWLYSGSAETLLAQRGSGGVPEVLGASFESFSRPILNDAGVVLNKAELQIGVGGVGSGENLGLWAFTAGNAHMIARSGSGDVPGIAGASFLDFKEMALNSAGLVAVRATLEHGAGIHSTNDAGLWVFDATGSGTLVARTGDQLAGRTIQALDFLGGSGGNDGIATGLNAAGQFVFQADFTNGDSGLFLFQDFSADFDGDGDIDAADLTHPTLGWNVRYGLDLAGDDFLDWQRQVGQATPLTPAISPVPEPTAVGLSSLLCLVLASRRHFI